MQNTDTILSSLAVTLDWIEVAQKTIPADKFVDHIILNLVQQRTMIGITDILTDREKECGPYSLSIGLDVGELKGGIPQISTLTTITLQQKLANDNMISQSYTIGRSTLT